MGGRKIVVGNQEIIRGLGVDTNASTEWITQKQLCERGLDSAGSEYSSADAP